MEFLIEISVESHAVVRNNIERFHVGFTQFSPVVTFGEIII